MTEWMPTELQQAIIDLMMKWSDEEDDLKSFTIKEISDALKRPHRSVYSCVMNLLDFQHTIIEEVTDIIDKEERSRRPRAFRLSDNGTCWTTDNLKVRGRV